jgi:hypothetical protein
MRKSSGSWSASSPSPAELLPALLGTSRAVRPDACLSFCLIHPSPGPFTSDRPRHVRAGHGRWRTVVNAGQHCWKACWGQPGRLLTYRRTPCSGSDALPEENFSRDLCCALALRSAVALTGRSTVACCFVTVSSVTDPAGTAGICGDDDEVTTANFRRFGRTLGATPGQRTTAGTDNESRAC